MVSIFDSSVTAAELFQADKMHCLWCNKQGFAPLFRFYILCVAVSDFCCLTPLQTPFTKARSRQFQGFSLAINFQAGVAVMCLDNTDSVSFWE